MLEFVTRPRPVKPGKIYGAPSDGNSGFISLVTALALIGLWFLVTGMGWVKLFVLVMTAKGHAFCIGSPRLAAGA